jgi:ElaB/YqjD/DUF883 family membrane-anchored ribosome-binding protein
MSDRAEGAVADTGEAIQRRINQADEVADEFTTFVRQHPVSALLIAVSVGYVLGKIV